MQRMTLCWPETDIFPPLTLTGGEGHTEPPEPRLKLILLISNHTSYCALPHHLLFDCVQMNLVPPRACLLRAQAIAEYRTTGRTLSGPCELVTCHLSNW